MPKLSQQKPDVVFRNAQPRKTAYLISDGDGLNLLVTPDGIKRWVFRYRFGGTRRSLTILRGYPRDSAKAARDEVLRLRAMIARGEDPRETRKAAKLAVSEQAEHEREQRIRNANTFEKVAREWHARKARELEESTSKANIQRLEKNIFPMIGSRPIADLKPPEILRPLRLLEQRSVLDTASKLLTMYGQIFRYAVHEGYIESDPSRDLRGAITPATQTHLAAFTKPKEVTELLQSMTRYHGSAVTKAAMLFGIMTFVRPGNLRTAEWEHFHNLDNARAAEWLIPSEQMKIKRDEYFVVPLAPQALRLLEELRPLTGDGKYLFPSERGRSRCMSNATVTRALRTMGYGSEEMAGHGFRAMARTMCHEILKFGPDELEEQLAHGKAGPLRGAYDRTKHMPERRRLMNAWAEYLEKLLGKPLLLTE